MPLHIVLGSLISKRVAVERVVLVELVASQVQTLELVLQLLSLLMLPRKELSKSI